MSAKLMAAISTGTRAESDVAFLELVTTWQGPITGYAFKMLRDWQQAEDVFSGVMLSVFQHAGNYRDQSFSGWLYSLTERRCIDVIRKRRNDALSQRVSPTDDFDPLSVVAGASRLPLDAIVEREELDDIAVAMEALPNDQRAVLELFQEGFSFGEIADASGANVHTTKRRAQLARGKVRDGVIQSRMCALVEKMFC